MRWSDASVILGLFALIAILAYIILEKLLIGGRDMKIAEEIFMCIILAVLALSIIFLSWTAADLLDRIELLEQQVATLIKMF